MTTQAITDPRPIDVTSWIGAYPFRDVPHPDPEILVRVLDREGFAGAWVGHLPGACYRDPVPSNRALYAAVAPFAGVLLPAPIVRPVRGDEHGHPVLVSRALFSPLRHAVASEGAKPIVRAHVSAAGDVVVNDAHAFRDIDTPEAYAGILNPPQ